MSEDPPIWLGIFAKSSLVSEYVERASVCGEDYKFLQ